MTGWLLKRTGVRFSLSSGWPEGRAFVKNERSFYSGEMPKVSDEHLAARREQVLRAAWACFGRNGFHATTMADVIAESGLSAGAVYRYFPGKADLVRATAERALGQVGGTVEELLASGEAIDPVTALERVLETVERMATSGPTDLSRIALMAWAEG